MDYVLSTDHKIFMRSTNFSSDLVFFRIGGCEISNTHSGCESVNDKLWFVNKIFQIQRDKRNRSRLVWSSTVALCISAR